MKFRTGIVALAAAGLTLTACSSGGGDEAAEAIATPSADASGTLKVWLMDGNGVKPLVDAVNAEFKKKYPNVEVQAELQQWAGIQDKLTTSLGTDSTPDVAEIGNSLTAKYADAGLLADLSAEAESLGVSNMSPGLQPSGELDGSRYGIPMYAGVRIVVYKKSDFEKAGITATPTSIDELGAAAAKLAEANKDNSKYSAFYFPGKYWYGAVPFVWTNGGEIATQDDSGAWTGTLNSAESVKGLNQLKDLVDKYSKAPKDGDETKNVDAFNTGNVGMMIDSWWAPGVLDAKGAKFAGDIGVFATPGVDAGTTAPVFAGGSDLAVSAKSKNQGLAVEWLKAMTGLQGQTALAKETGNIPNQEGALVGYQGRPDEEFLAVAGQASTNSKFTPVSPNWGNVESSQVLQDMLVKIFTGKSSVEDATTEASEAITTTLNE